MTNERSNTDSNGVTDSIVSQAYRESAEERVPADLDRAVLRRAASAARPRYARSILWLRPLAWTATVGLCLVIVLEMSRVPLPDPEALEMPNAPDALEEKSSLAEKYDVIPAQPTLDRSDLRKRSDEDVAEPEMRQTLASPSPESFAIQNPGLLQQANDLARIQGDNVVKAEQPALRSLTSKAATEISIPADCDEDASASPSVWLECIENLETAGLMDAAHRERERFRSTFPDFELP